MKIHLQRPGDDERPGFVNVRNGVELEALAEDAEVTELVANDSLDFEDHPGEALEHWVGKLRRGGTLVLGGLDLLAVSLGVARRQLPVDRAASLLFRDGRRGGSCLEAMCDQLRGLGLEILHRRLDGHFYTITARRP